MADERGGNKSDGDAERREERREQRSRASEVNANECEIRGRPPLELPSMLSEGAEGSPSGGQSRKRLHDFEDEYDRQSLCERVSRSRMRDRGDYHSRRRRSRSISVRDYRGAERFERTSRNRSRSREVNVRRRRRLHENVSQHRRSRSSSYEHFENSENYLRRHTNSGRNRRMERKRHLIYTSSSDDGYRVASKRKRMYSRSPSVDYARGPTKVSRKVRLHNTVSERLPETNDSIVSKFLDIIKDMKGHSSSKLSLNNVLPEFDPMSKEQTILTWLTKVEECAEIYGWNERETIHFALPKLIGVAKTWYQGLSTVLYSWTEWKKKLVESFPCRDDYAELLIAMLTKKARYGDSLEHYYYAKTNLLNRCGIKGRKAVDCLLNGIEDRAVRVGAQAANFREPEEVLKYLKTVKVVISKEIADKPEKQRQDKRLLGNFLGRRTEPPRKISCYNCNEDGHKSFNCKKTLVNCSTCGKSGHLPSFCRFSRDNSNSVNQKGTFTKDEENHSEEVE
jgi:hypothetical protein